MRIKILGFEKYKGRSDVKHNSWFRCSNRILEDHEFFGFTHEEMLVWIYLLSISSQKNTSDIVVSHQHAHQVCRLSPEAVDSALKKLKEIKCIEVCRPRTVRGRYADDTQTCATDRHNRQDNTEQDTTVNSRPAKPPATPNDLDLNRRIWKSYSDAYFARYGTEPVRNAAVNSKIKQVGQKLGDEAPDVAAFYVTLNKAFYVSNLHPVGLLASDAEGLRTQWATDSPVTNRQAQQADQSSALREQLKKFGGA